MQIYLCEILKLPIPNFLHIPIITDKQGCKLSKQSGAEALPKHQCAHVLAQALQDLGQHTPNKLAEENLETIWEWAVKHWNTTKIPKSQSIPLHLP